MRRFNSLISLCFTVLVFATFALAGPLSKASSPNHANRLVKRLACSNGIKTNCGSASVGCSGSQFTVCCGTSCQCFRLAPRDNSYGSSTPIVTPDYSGKCGSGGASSSPPTGSGSSSSSGTIKNSLLCRLFKVGC
ncbi:hypothetical protein D6D01_02071 [Aureobasidium pullulans]|uniref:Uncharacterized protein n=1 Tax=Aureobasidium pullulans TaxID=5580 RepID=A0A4S9LVT2_AURPU|nr:hypothetical protein D6D01_02071 [Aureobasidium pullulans]